VEDVEEVKKIIIQVNGKVRKVVEDANLSEKPTEDELIEFVVTNSNVTKEKIKKVIFVQDKIISVVI
jgi:hypothetical protein